MADQDHRGAAGRQELLQPLGRRQVEVVRRLVEEHNLRLGQQKLRQPQTVKFPAAERGGGTVKFLIGKTDPV